VAVSGGVDSMVLLGLVRRLPGVELIVAHFDHGIRGDSAEDRKLVQETAEKYDLQFEYAEGVLGVGTSEDIARKARYEFLHGVRQKYKADAIVTAHHQDDLIETALLNLLRGTGRKGLTSLQSTDIIRRPLLEVTKQEILAYAKANDIEWREDITNSDTTYLRNYIRKNLMPKLSEGQRKELVNQLTTLREQNLELDIQIANYLQYVDGDLTKLSKQNFVQLPHDVACEAMASWLRLNNIRDFDRKIIERVVVAAKTFRPGQRADINNMNYLLIELIWQSNHMIASHSFIQSV
jgi:tRNA(Ile)-lysidine synthetase-like protein